MGFQKILFFLGADQTYISADPGRRAQLLCSIQKMSAKKPPNQNPKSKIKIQNPKSKIQNPKSKIQNLHKKNCSIRLQSPKSNIRNPKSKIRNPKSKIQNPRENPKFGAVGASRKGMLHNDPKSKIPEIRPKKFGFWILDSAFWILGGSGGCTTRQFSDGALRSEARIPPGPSLGGGAKPTVSDTVGERERTWFGKSKTSTGQANQKCE